MVTVAIGYGVVGERRIIAKDRRAKRAAMRFPDRGSGYDRRSQSKVQRFVWDIGRRSNIVATLVTVFVILNIIDLLITVIVVGGGQAYEWNPITASLLASGPTGFVLYKLLLTVVVAGVIWLLRRYYVVMKLLLLSVTLYLGIVAYELVSCYMYL